MVRPLDNVSKSVQLTRRTLTRSHVALGARPALRAAMVDATHQVAALLSTRLAAQVEVEVELLASAVKGSNSLATPAVFALLSLDEVGGFAVAELAPQLVSSFVDRLAGGAGEPLAPQPMSEAEEAGASLLVLDVLAALRASPAEHALGPRLVRFVHSAAELSALTDLRVPHLAVRAHVRCEKAAGWVRVLVPASALRFWLEGTAAEYAPLAPEVAAAGLPFAIRAGHAALTPADLDALVTGDVILFDGVSGTRDALSGAARIAGTHFTLSGVIGPDGFTVEVLNLNKETNMAAATQVTRAPELPVDVEVELAKVRLTLAELGAIAPGGVIPLRIAPGEPVALKVGDATVAIAELVDVDGEIGARILRLTP